MMWRKGTLAFYHSYSVMAVARTEWLVYVWDSPAPRKISFIIVASVLTSRGLFSYQIISILWLSLTVAGKKLGLQLIEFLYCFKTYQYESLVSLVEHSRVRLS